MDPSSAAPRPPPSSSESSRRRYRPRKSQRNGKGKGKETARPADAVAAMPEVPEVVDQSDWEANAASEPSVERSEDLEDLRHRLFVEQKKKFLTEPKKYEIRPDALARLSRARPPRPPADPRTSDYDNWGTREVGSPGRAPPSDDEVIYTGRRRKGKKLPHGSHVLGEHPKGPVPNQVKKATVPPKRQFGAKLTSAAPEHPGSSSSSRAGSPTRKKQPAPAKPANREVITDDSGTKLRADAPKFEPGQAVPPHLRAVVAAGKIEVSYPEWGPPPETQKATSSKKPGANAAAPRQRQPQPQNDRREGGGRGGRGDGRRANYRGRGGGRPPRIFGFEEVEEATGMRFPTVKNFKSRANLQKGPEDIATRIHREIGGGSYECMVCFEKVTRRQKIWSCKCCWGVYHLHCIQKWSHQGLEAPPTRPIGGNEPVRTWRCPSCNNPEEEVPAHYTCWCQKSLDPESSKYFPAHSCGQTCGKPRSSTNACPHPCDQQCHAGPCPPCTAIGPVQTCFCGKENSQRRCTDTDYENGWSCGQICGDFMPCGEHTCAKSCHPLMCGSCEETELLSCYCGNERTAIKCCDKQESSTSQKADADGNIDEWEGHYKCDKICNRPFDCGFHQCKLPCHTQELSDAHCPLSPDIVTHCPCGKTKLSEISPSPRKSCQAEIPSCDKTCNKTLPCGHACMMKCHDGDCGYCRINVGIACRCGKTISPSMCHQGVGSEPPQCMRQCKAGLNCGRHECGEKCCSGEQKANERLAAKKKTKFSNSSTTPGLQTDDGFEPEHICTRPCGRLLKCGKHNCPMLCHRGPCGTCLEASFDELSCNCGQTVVAPPIPCGTKPPKCTHPCTRGKACGHPIVPHDCHTDDENCPPCPYLVEKLCKCGKKQVKAVQCWREGVSCGTECGKRLSCGSHTCRKSCHTDNCENPCTQECGKSKPTCGHKCLNACHAPFQCNEQKPCTQKVHLSCPCGGIKQEVKCGSTKANPTGNKQELKCADECRSRRLALALELDPDREGTPLYSEETIAAYMLEKKRCTELEQSVRNFAQTNSSKETHFQPMNKFRREFVHCLAADYGLDSESRDQEPYRSVFLFKGPRYSGAPPRKTIAEYLALNPVEVAPPSAVQQLKKARRLPFNAILLHRIRVGMLAAELERELAPCLKDANLFFNINWHGDEDVLLEPKPSSLAVDQVEAELHNISPKVKRYVAASGLAESAELCWVGKEGKIASRESEKWSLVANKKSAPSTVLTQYSIASRNGFSVFSGSSDAGPADTRAAAALAKKKSAEAVKKPRPEDIVDDWEIEADSTE